MRKLTKPTEKPLDVFRLCISNYSDAALKARLNSAETEVVKQADDFEVKVKVPELFKIKTQTNVGSASAKEMENVYTFKMARKKAPGRALYDKLLSAPNQ